MKFLRWCMGSGAVHFNTRNTAKQILRHDSSIYHKSSQVITSRLKSNKVVSGCVTFPFACMLSNRAYLSRHSRSAIISSLSSVRFSRTKSKTSGGQPAASSPRSQFFSVYIGYSIRIIDLQTEYFHQLRRFRIIVHLRVLPLASQFGPGSEGQIDEQTKIVILTFTRITCSPSSTTPLLVDRSTGTSSLTVLRMYGK